jgi:GxxExxY protein
MKQDGDAIADSRVMEQRDAPKLAHGAVTGEILKAFFDVYRELGYGFSEVVYRRALAIVIRALEHEVLEEVPLEVHFRGAVIGRFHADLIVARVVMVETKAAAALESYAEAQLLNYLKAAGGGVGMLLNFGHQPTFKRLVLGSSNPSLPALQVRGG